MIEQRAVDVKKETDAVSEVPILLYRGAGKRRTQVRLMAVVAGVQFVLGIAYFESLWLLKQKEADAEYKKAVDEFEERKEGVTPQKRPFTSYLSWIDITLSGFVAIAPFVLLSLSRFSCGRWIHELSLLPRNDAVVVETFNLLGQRVQRNIPAVQVRRSSKYEDRLYVQGKVYVFPDGGEHFNNGVFVRTFRDQV